MINVLNICVDVKCLAQRYNFFFESFNILLNIRKFLSALTAFTFLKRLVKIQNLNFCLALKGNQNIFVFCFVIGNDTNAYETEGIL